MLSDSTLSGTESSSFFDLYGKFQRNITSIMKTGPEIRREWEKAKALSQQTTDPVLVQELDDQLYKWSDMWATYQEIQNQVDEWGQKWIGVSESATQDAGTQLGVLFLLPAWALGSLVAGGLAALTFVVTKGMDLVAQVRFEKSVLSQVQRKIITAGEAGKLIGAARPSTFGIDLGLPLFGLAAVGAAYYFLTVK